MHKTTAKFCKKNPNIIFTRVDKGNVTVAMNREEYNNKMEELLQDKNTYIPIKKNPTKNIEKNLNSTIKKCWKHEHITKQISLLVLQ